MNDTLRMVMVLALGASAPSASAGDGDLKPRLNGEIRGRVVDGDTKLPLFASAVLVDAGINATTREDGSFRIKNVPPGSYAILVRSTGYRSVGRRVVVSWATTTHIAHPFVLVMGCGPDRRRPTIAELDDSTIVVHMLSGFVEPRLPPTSREHFEEIKFGGARRSWSIYDRSDAPWNRNLPLTLDEVRSWRSDNLRAERAFAQWTEVWKTRSGLR